MRLRVLGCSGGELGHRRTTSFLLDDRVALDAGALNRSLTLPELEAIERVVLTHAHLDHVKDLPLLADLLVERRRPLVVHASTGCARTLREHLFNGELWPDFTRLPDAERPALVLEPFEAGRGFQAGGFQVLPVPVHHPVESVGLVVSDGECAFALSGDTGPTEALWEAVNRTPRLRALLVETSFPDRLQWLADASGHLTPATLRGELAKVTRGDWPVLLYHLKPVYRAEVLREVEALGLPGLRALEEGEELDLRDPGEGQRPR